LQVAVDGHDLCATETYTHKTLTMSTKSLFSREKIVWKKKVTKQAFFRFRQHSPKIPFGRIFGRLFSAEYLAENVFGRSLIPFVHWLSILTLIFNLSFRQFWVIYEVTKFTVNQPLTVNFAIFN
jgi:hypothetical protein